MNTHYRPVRLPLAIAAGLLFLGGCHLSSLTHKEPEAETYEYSSTGRRIATVAKKKSWLDRLKLDNLRDERTIEVERHMAGGL